MKAIDFSNDLANVVKDFFAQCLRKETVPLHKMREITVCFTDKGFSLRLKTLKNDFSQDFEVSDKKMTPLYFVSH